MSGVFLDVPFFIKAGDHKSLAITRYLAFSLFSENVSKERIYSFYFIGSTVYPCCFSRFSTPLVPGR